MRRRFVYARLWVRAGVAAAAPVAFYISMHTPGRTRPCLPLACLWTAVVVVVVLGFGGVAGNPRVRVLRRGRGWGRARAPPPDGSLLQPPAWAPPACPALSPPAPLAPTSPCVHLLPRPQPPASCLLPACRPPRFVSPSSFLVFFMQVGWRLGLGGCRPHGVHIRRRPMEVQAKGCMDSRQTRCSRACLPACLLGPERVPTSRCLTCHPTQP